MALDTSIALTTYEKIKGQLSLPDDSQQPFIESQINVVSNKIACYCNRNFGSQEYNQKYKGNDELELVLDQYPITLLSALSIDDCELEDLTVIDTQEKEGILYYENIFNSNGYVKGISGSPTLRFKNIQVVYTAGYILPDQPNSNLPYDLEQACINEVIRNYSNKTGQGTQNIKSWTIESAKKVFTDVDKLVDFETGFLKETTALLDVCYRKIVI